MQTPKYKTREEWLIAAAHACERLFEAKGRKVPPIRVSTGWPSKKPLSAESRSVGECWAAECSEDGVTQIFISPWLKAPVEGDSGVLPVLVHEMAHAVVGVEHGHKKPFKECAQSVGLVGRMTESHAGEELLEVLNGIVEDLGPYPHSRLDKTKSGKKSQGTRMLKCVCVNDQCGFTVRMVQKWVDEVGVAHCPKHGAMNLEVKEPSGE